MSRRATAMIRDAINCAYSAGVALVLTSNAQVQLEAEVGVGAEAALKWLLDLVAGGTQPIGVYIRNPDGRSVTVFVGPRGWTRERLAGHVATLAFDVQAYFGEATPIDRREAP
jgi:hypothetical protein